MNKKLKIAVLVRGAKSYEEVSLENDKLVMMKGLIAQSLQQNTIMSLNFMSFLSQIGVTLLLNRQFYAQLMFQYLNAIKDDKTVKNCFAYAEIEAFKAAFKALIDFESISANDADSLFLAANLIRFIITDPLGVFVDTPKIKTSILKCVLMLTNKCDIFDDTKGFNKKLMGLIYNYEFTLHAAIVAQSPAATKKLPVTKSCKKRKCAEIDVVTIDNSSQQEIHASEEPKEVHVAKYCISPISIVGTDFNDIDWSPRPFATIDGYMTPLSVLATSSMETTKLYFEEEEGEADSSFKAMCTHITGTKNASHDQADVHLGGDIESVPCWESLFVDFSISGDEQLELFVY